MRVLGGVIQITFLFRLQCVGQPGHRYAETYLENGGTQEEPTEDSHSRRANATASRRK